MSWSKNSSTNFIGAPAATSVPHRIPPERPSITVSEIPSGIFPERFLKAFLKIIISLINSGSPSGNHSAVQSVITSKIPTGIPTGISLCNHSTIDRRIPLEMFFFKNFQLLLLHRFLQKLFKEFL